MNGPSLQCRKGKLGAGFHVLRVRGRGSAAQIDTQRRNFGRTHIILEVRETRYGEGANDSEHGDDDHQFDEQVALVVGVSADLKCKSAAL